ncbi:hypothetical protein L1D52_24365 [Vibrio brasiliensis]|nr:hypothetical protein [Vibrio brasiliensis]MCG9785446.1 hypothetical protein [Vibrio brasiliensis]
MALLDSNGTLLNGGDGVSEQVGVYQSEYTDALGKRSHPEIETVFANM